MRFNSNMVRLKGLQADVSCEMNAVFQFQYGAIKRIEKEIIQELATMFQFQYGAIKSGLLGAKECGRDIVSIPIWCD